ncbi:MAG: Flp pilus assembly complex ATPase component TadA [Candidatus Omnitrophica bacterium]|nr:Flp pilus assembly complex ATPase component TadA [Candidatus Omnitrophota bacterium]
MMRLKLGEILIKQGFITQEQLDKAIQVQKVEKTRIGETLVRLGFVTEENMTQAIGTQLAIPFYSSENPQLLTTSEDQKEDLKKLISESFARKNDALPLSKHMHSLTCAVADPLDLLLIDNLKRMTGCELNLVIATKSSIQKAINLLYHGSPANLNSDQTMLTRAVESSYSDDSDEGVVVFKTASAELSMDKLIAKAGEAPVIKLVDLIIRQAIDEKASDIHIEPFENKIKLRYRIDGSLVDLPPPAPHLLLPIVSRIKILAKLDIAEKRLPQDGAISAKLEDRNVDLRVSTIPTIWGEKVVMRILDKGSVPLALSGLGFDTKQVDIMKKALKMPYGLFFVTGPTGSGKSTTLYAAVNETRDPRKNIITVEDPVEYKLEGINQVNVKPDIGLTFATALKAFLRQDPDIMMVGETRDLETAQICVRAALTGHFVMSTLHTNDAPSAISRLIDIGVPNYLLTPSMVMILAQRLAKRLCQNCKEAYEPDALAHGNIKFKSDLIYKAKGCQLCNHTGYKGRIVIGEVLEVNEEIRSLIAQNAGYQKIKDTARKNGMDTLFDSGLKLVEKGITSFEEIGNVCVSVD